MPSLLGAIGIGLGNGAFEIVGTRPRLPIARQRSWYRYLPRCRSVGPLEFDRVRDAQCMGLLIFLGAAASSPHQLNDCSAGQHEQMDAHPQRPLFPKVILRRDTSVRDVRSKSKRSCVSSASWHVIYARGAPVSDLHCVILKRSVLSSGTRWLVPIVRSFRYSPKHCPVSVSRRSDETNPRHGEQAEL